MKSETSRYYNIYSPYLFLPKYFKSYFLLLFLLFKFDCGYAQCPQLDALCRCAPSIYEPIAIICENAGSLKDALRAIENAKTLLVIVYNKKY